jgi:hypothetical protein
MMSGPIVYFPSTEQAVPTTKSSDIQHQMINGALVVFVDNFNLTRFPFRLDVYVDDYPLNDQGIKASAATYVSRFLHAGLHLNAGTSRYLVLQEDHLKLGENRVPGLLQVRPTADTFLRRHPATYDGV